MGQIRVFEDTSAGMSQVICIEIYGDISWEQVYGSHLTIGEIIGRREGRFDVIVNRHQHSGFNGSHIDGLSHFQEAQLPGGGAVVVVGDHFMSVWMHQLNDRFHFYPVLYTVPTMREAYRVVALSRAEKPVPEEYRAPRRG
jgi:hypothetical protein